MQVNKNPLTNDFTNKSKGDSHYERVDIPQDMKDYKESEVSQDEVNELPFVDGKIIDYLKSIDTSLKTIFGALLVVVVIAVMK